MHVLECFSAQEPELGITQISEKLQINKSNVHNILSTFAQMGYIEQLPSGKYCLGLKMLEYAFVINEHLGYPKAVYDILSDVAEEVDEIAYFGLPRGTNVLYLYVVHPRSKIEVRPYRNILGEKAPMYCTGIGKAMLAHLPEEEWAEHIPAERTRFTEYTITDYDKIMQELRLTRQRGYAIDNRERDLRDRCVGMPVFNTQGKLVGGSSIAGYAGTMTDEKLERCSRLLAEATYKMRERIYN